MAHLRTVNDDDTDLQPETPPVRPTTLPDFEGETVTQAQFKLTSVGALEAPDTAVRIDDVVKLYVEGRVTRVDHVVDEKTGTLKRVQTIKAVDTIQLPWEVDPDDFR
jgi:hypothetical protein